MGRKGKKALSLDKARSSLQAKHQQDQVDEDENSTFHGIKSKMVRQCITIIDNIPDPDERERLWRNPREHLCGDHDNCVPPNQFPAKKGRPPKNEEEGKQKQFKVRKRGAESPQIKGGLYKYRDKTVNFVRKAAHANDSYNKQITVYAPKKASPGVILTQRQRGLQQASIIRELYLFTKLSTLKE